MGVGQGRSCPPWFSGCLCDASLSPHPVLGRAPFCLLSMVPSAARLRTDRKVLGLDFLRPGWGLLFSLPSPLPCSLASPLFPPPALTSPSLLSPFPFLLSLLFPRFSPALPPPHGPHSSPFSSVLSQPSLALLGPFLRARTQQPLGARDAAAFTV